MGELDHGAKLALRVDALSLPSAREVAPLPQQVVSAERTSDSAYAAVVDDDEVTIHIEMEAEPTSDVGARVSRAACSLYVAHGRPVRPIIDFLHPAKDGRRPKWTHALPIGVAPALLRFEHVAWWELAPEDMLSRPTAGLLPFVPFTREATVEHVRRAAELIDQLPLLPVQRYDTQSALYLLATTREQFPTSILNVIIPKEIRMKSAGYLEAVGYGEAKGRATGRVEMLLIQLQERLGEVPAELTSVVQAAGARGDLPALDSAARLLARPLAEPELVQRLVETLRPT